VVFTIGKPRDYSFLDQISCHIGHKGTTLRASDEIRVDKNGGET